MWLFDQKIEKVHLITYPKFITDQKRSDLGLAINTLNARVVAAKNYQLNNTLKKN